MLGVQSCKHFGCQRSHPMILGFGHPSGAMEDGARGKILVFKQWKWTDYYINYVESVYSRVNCSSWANKKVVLWCKGWILTAVQNAWWDKFFQGPKISSEKWSHKKSKFDHVPGFPPQFWHRNPILHKKSHLYRVSEGFFSASFIKSGWRDEFFQGAKIFLRLTLCWKNFKWKVVPQKA